MLDRDGVRVEMKAGCRIEIRDRIGVNVCRTSTLAPTLTSAPTISLTLAPPQTPIWVRYSDNHLLNWPPAGNQGSGT